MKTHHIQQQILESGQQLNGIEVKYQTYGSINEEQSNVVWVFHAISGDTQVLEWWDGLFGEGKLYDPSEYFIVCANCICSPFGSTKPTNLEFPQITWRSKLTGLLVLKTAATKGSRRLGPWPC